MPDTIKEACPNIEGCIYFNDREKSMPAMSELYKQRYCLDDYHTCARYQVARAIGKENVPRDLHPNERDRAQVLVHA